jgi:hypothetical protein
MKTVLKNNWGIYCIAIIGLQLITIKNNFHITCSSIEQIGAIKKEENITKKEPILQNSIIECNNIHSSTDIIFSGIFY